MLHTWAKTAKPFPEDVLISRNFIFLSVEKFSQNCVLLSKSTCITLSKFLKGSLGNTSQHKDDLSDIKKFFSRLEWQMKF